MNILISAKSFQGTKTLKNQDSFAIPQEKHDTRSKGWLFIVCDGLGGYYGSEIASQMCCQMLLDDYYNSEDITNFPLWFQDKFTQINNAVITQAEKLNYKQMSTTAVCLLIKDNKAYITNCGDSRLYLFTDSKLVQVTEDHSVVWEYYKQGYITKDEIILSSRKNLLTEAIGLGPEPKVDSYIIDLPDKFTLMLCSDGLTDVATDSEIENVLYHHTELKQCVKALYNLSQAHFSRDDVTVVVVSKT
jgi:serine/threonine protein phosphatase PrpC